ncbi:MAG: hypothetical protein OEV44_00795 [Spirochaetota bacterium]|nr:hypothetical protein [Spirochaetota bacterium]
MEKVLNDKILEIQEYFYNDISDTDRWKYLGKMCEDLVKETIKNYTKNKK